MDPKLIEEAFEAGFWLAQDSPKVSRKDYNEAVSRLVAQLTGSEVVSSSD